MNENIFDLKACRLCLETNCRLYDINKNKLTKILDEFTSSTASDMTGIPPYVCSLCSALLRKATTFRNRCMEIQNYLHECSLIEPLNIDIIQKTDRSKIKNQLKTSDIVVTYCIDGDTVDNKDEIKSENETENNDNDDFHDNIIEFEFPMNDFVKLEDDIKPESSNIDVIKPVKKTKHKKKHKDTIKKTKDNVNKNVLKEALQQQIIDATDEHRKAFYTFVVEKYVLELKKINELIDPFDSDDEVLVKKSVPNADCLEKMDPNKRVFYDFLCEKYKKGTLQEKKVVNVTRLHSKKALRNTQNKTRHREKEDLQRFGDDLNFEVIVLSKKEQIAEVMARKDNPKFVNSPYKCEVCFRGFRAEKTYRTHLIAHDPSTGDDVCEICQSRFASRRKMTTHAQKHKWKFICKTCGAIFKCSTEARNHYASHGGKKYICEHCGKIFTRYRSRLDHIRIHHGASRCDICYKGMSNTNAVNLHKSKAHKQVFICDVCNVIFNKKSALNTHLSVETTCVNSRPCSACGENLKTDAELEDHIMSVHPYIRPDFTPGRKIGSRNRVRCCPCGHAPLYDQQHYGTHKLDGNYPPKLDMIENYHKITDDYKMAADSNPEFKMAPNTTELKIPETNTESNEYYPNYCNCPCKLVVRRRKRRRRIELEREGDIKRHASEDDDDTPKKKKYMCEVCAKDNFQTITSLREHQLIHTGEKPHQCQVCWKRFRLRCLLQMHMTVHTGERAYKCDSCDKMFKTAPARNRHLLVHTGERRHKCSMCDKRFQTTSCLKTHVKSVHMKIPYPPCRANRR